MSCGAESDEIEPAGSVYIYSQCHERLSADAAGQLSWREKVDASCVWTVQRSLTKPGKYTLRSRHNLYLSHNPLWGYHANKVHPFMWEEFDIAQLPSIYPTFGAKAAFRLKFWMGGTLCKGVEPKAVVSGLILDETLNSNKTLDAEETGEIRLPSLLYLLAFFMLYILYIIAKWTDWRQYLDSARDCCVMQTAFWNVKSGLKIEMSCEDS